MLKKMFWQMSIAQIAASMIVILCLLIDSVMIGKFLGLSHMAAYGLANPVLLALAAVGSMISAGAQIMCSKSIGSGNKTETNTYFTTTIVLCIIVSVVAMFGVGSFAGPISEILGADRSVSPELYYLTRNYLLGFEIGIPAFLFATALVPFLQLSGKQGRLITSVVMMIVSDIVCDLLNVFVFKGGMFGMGLASSISYYVACIIGFSGFLKKDCIFKFRIRLLNMKDVRNMLRAGVITIVNMFGLVLLAFTFNRILLTLGNPKVSVAAYSIISTASNICYSFSSGISSVTLMLAGVYYFENDKRTLHNLLKLTLRSVLIVDSIVAIFVIAIAPYIVMMFMQEGQEQAISLATFGLRIFAVSLVPCGVTAGLKNYYQGTLHLKLTGAISVLQNFLCISGFAYILSRFWGTTGVWLGYVCGETLVILIIMILVFVKTGSVGFSIKKFSLLPDCFGVPDEHFLRSILYTMEDVVRFSEETRQFCKNHGTNHYCAYYAALCIEEIGNIILTHAKEQKTKRKAIEASLFFNQPELTLRIRDEGHAFNPVEYNEMVVSDNLMSHMGIRMVFLAAKEIKYSNAMSQNSLAITIESSAFENSKRKIG